MGNSLTPLQEASSQGHLEVVEFLIKKGACVNLQQHGSPSALQFAAFLKDNRLIKLLLDNGAKVNAPAGKYGTALQAVSQKSSWMEEVDTRPVVQLLENVMKPKEQQLDFNAGFLQLRRVETAKFLLDAGADITGPGCLLSEIWAASIGGNAGVAELLIERAADNTGLRESLGQVLEGLYKRDDSGPDLYSLAGFVDTISSSSDDDDNDNYNEGNDVSDDGNGSNRANKDSPSSQWQRRVGVWIEQQSVRGRA